ncbi:unnamed protein product, partial [Didymodactylos carnosus]
MTHWILARRRFSSWWTSL